MNKFLIKEKTDNFIFILYNIFSNFIFVLFKFKDRQLIKKNVYFKNKHAGERCFILGNGPSLKTVNPDFLKNEIVFGVNYLHRSELINEITPTYYCLYDNGLYRNEIETTKEIIEKLPNTKFFLRTKAHDVINNLNINDENIYYQYTNLYQFGDYVKVDMTKNMTACVNVVLGCIQNAIYMGFKEIYLLGCDFNSFASLKVEHCYDKGDAPDRIMSVGFELKFYSIVSYHHYALERYARKKNIQIYNLTPKSLLDAYQKVEIENII